MKDVKLSLCCKGFGVYWVVIAAFLGPFCSILYEFMLAKQIGLLAGNDFFWQGVGIGVFIGSMGFGFLYPIPLKPRVGSLWSLELLLSFGGSALWFVILLWHGVFRIHFRGLGHVSEHSFPAIFVWAASCQLLVAFIGYLSGKEAQLLWKYMRATSAYNQSVLWICLQYLSALSATLFMILGIFPFASIGFGLLWASIGNGLLLLLLWILRKKRMWDSIVLAILGVWMLGLCWLIPQAEQWALKNHFYNEIAWKYVPDKGITQTGPRPLFAFLQESSQLRDIQIRRSAYQNIHLVPYTPIQRALRNFSHKQEFSLYLNYHYQLDSKHEALYHETMAHVPFMLTDSDPKNIAVIGGGDGLLVRELLKYPKIEKITLVELDQKMVQLANEIPLVDLNRGSLKDSRVDIKIEDGILFMAQAKSFGAVFLDLPFPFSAELSRLFSVEFYRLVFQHLSKNGILVADLPLAPRRPLNSAENRIFFDTLFAAGFEQIVAFRSGFEGFVLALKERQDVNFVYKNSLNLFALKPSWFQNQNNYQKIAINFEGDVHSMLQYGLGMRFDYAL